MMYDCLVGTSIWDRLILAKNSDTAIDRDGAKASSISRTFDGMCVKTIVFTRPIFDAIFEDAIYEMAVSTPATANMYDNEERSAPNESTAKSEDIFQIMLLDFGEMFFIDIPDSFSFTSMFFESIRYITRTT